MARRSSELNDIKADFSNAYNQELPDSYYSCMSALEYQIPENAKPTLNFVLSKLKQEKAGTLNVLDIGCSYGVLSAIVKHDLPLYTLYNKFGNKKGVERNAEFDRKWYSELPRRDDVKFYGLDISENAIRYAETVGLLEGGTSVNLEQAECSLDTCKAVPRSIDLIVSTGCIGYVTDLTFSKILDHVSGHSKPIFLSFVLRAYDYSPIQDLLYENGYLTQRMTGKTFIQRRFMDSSEKEGMLELLENAGNKQCPEQNGYFHAELFLSHHKSVDTSVFNELV